MKNAKITNAIIFMIAKDNLPFNTVEQESFQYVMKTIASLYPMPGGKTITSLLEEKYSFNSQCLDRYSEHKLFRRSSTFYGG